MKTKVNRNCEYCGKPIEKFGESIGNKRYHSWCSDEVREKRLKQDSRSS